jgi:DNA repair photolyase
MVNVSLISLDRDLLRRLEPRAPRPDLRLAAMEALAAAGVPARLFAMPVLPYLTDGEEALRSLVEAAARAGAREVVWNVLFLRGSTRGFFLGFLGREMPWLVSRYETLFAAGAWAPAEYRESIDRLMKRLGSEAGLGPLSREERVNREGPARPRQLALFW